MRHRDDRKVVLMTCLNVSMKLFAIGTVIMAILGIIFYSVDLYRQGHKKHLIGWISSGGFMLLTIPISVRLIFQHLTNWQAPRIQKFVVRIIWMVPIYSVESWLALRYRSLTLYMETLRECYEAYVIFSFLYYLIALFGDEQHLVSVLRSKPEGRGIHKFPMNLFLRPWSMGSEILHKCKVGVLQYVVIKNLMALIVIILDECGRYSEGSFRWDRGYVYICFINNMSQLWALYCLILFYYATREELTPWRPVSKFLCVKSVVFFTWWQSLAINFLSETTSLIHPSSTWSDLEIAKAIQDYLICIEMFVASIAFAFAFPAKEYMLMKSKDHFKKSSDSANSVMNVGPTAIGNTAINSNIAHSPSKFHMSHHLEGDEIVDDDDNESQDSSRLLNTSNLSVSSVNSPTMDLMMMTSDNCWSWLASAMSWLCPSAMILEGSGNGYSLESNSAIQDTDYHINSTNSISNSINGISSISNSSGSSGGSSGHSPGGTRLPFLSAIWQSSLPEEIFQDIKRFARGQELSLRSASSYYLTLDNSGETPRTADETSGTPPLDTSGSSENGLRRTSLSKNEQDFDIEMKSVSDSNNSSNNNSNNSVCQSNVRKLKCSEPDLPVLTSHSKSKADCKTQNNSSTDEKHIKRKLFATNDSLNNMEIVENEESSNVQEDSPLII